MNIGLIVGISIGVALVLALIVYFATRPRRTQSMLPQPKRMLTQETTTPRNRDMAKRIAEKQRRGEPLSHSEEEFLKPPTDDYNANAATAAGYRQFGTKMTRVGDIM